MNSDIQSKIAQLGEKGWTLAAIADELGVTSDTVELWRAGKRNPTNAKGVLLMLSKVLTKKRVPKKKRYTKGSRQKKNTEGGKYNDN
jgi:transcriptional regulator with XRE-family HTH domain